MRRIVLLALVVIASIPTPVQAASLLEIDVPSQYVDPGTALFAYGKPTDALRATVMLPDGYDGLTRFPVLYLLHPTNGDHRSWVRPEQGDITAVAEGLRAIVVMPEGGLGFFSDWWNGGLRCCPAWERYYLDELVPLIEQRFRVLPGRRWHAIGGFSMGGGGAALLASQRPSYFGTVVSFSGTTLSIQRRYTEAGFPFAAAFPYAFLRYDHIWGPSADFYASGHNPLELIDNLHDTRVFASAGNGVPRPGVPPPSAGELLASPAVAGIEFEARSQTDEFVSAALAHGVVTRYVTHDGIHDWPYVRADLRTAIRWGLFEAVPDRPEQWTYRTVALSGEAWGLRYAFAEPPTTVETLRREGHRISGAGRGRVTITTEDGCRFTVELPFDRPLGCSG